MQTILWILLSLLGILLGGCQSPVKVEALAFSHEDEMARKDEFIVLADRRVFAVMAFINVCGFDKEHERKGMHPVRIRVRQAMQAKAKEHPGAFDRWQQYYQKQNLPSYTYLNYALSLNDDHPFKRIRPNSELWQSWTGVRLADFPAMLNHFWDTLDMEQIWTQVKPHYLAEIQRYDFDRMNHQLVFIWEYLRLERRDQFTFVSVPNLLDSHYQAIGSQYENYWYMVESPGSGSHGINVHEYLHSIVEPLVRANYKNYQAKLDMYFQAGKDMPRAESYGHPVTYTFECLVRALDHRIKVMLNNNPTTIAQCESRVASLTRGGLLLVQPFYQRLGEYESGSMNFEEFIPEVLGKIPDYSIK